jgi:hypothetical protein
LPNNDQCLRYKPAIANSLAFRPRPRRIRSPDTKLAAGVYLSSGALARLAFVRRARALRQLVNTKEVDMNHFSYDDDYRQAWSRYKGLLGLNLILFKLLLIGVQVVLALN